MKVVFVGIVLVGLIVFAGFVDVPVGEAQGLGLGNVDDCRPEMGGDPLIVRDVYVTSLRNS